MSTCFATRRTRPFPRRELRSATSRRLSTFTCNTRPLLCAGTTSPGGSRQRALDGAFSPSPRDPATPRPRHAARTACCDRRESRRRSRVCRATRGSSPVRTLRRAAGLRRARRLSRGLELLSPLTTRLGAQSPALAAAPPGRRRLRVGGGVLVRVEPRSARAHCRPPPSPASTLPPGPRCPSQARGSSVTVLPVPSPALPRHPAGSFLARGLFSLSGPASGLPSSVGGWSVLRPPWRKPALWSQPASGCEEAPRGHRSPDACPECQHRGQHPPPPLLHVDHDVNVSEPQIPRHTCSKGSFP